MISRLPLTIAIIITITGTFGSAPRITAEDTAENSVERFFEHEVRPLLVEHCVGCHGAEEASSGLRLDARADLLRGGERGPAVVPGQPAQSLLVKAVRRQDELQMPPDEPLEDDQIRVLERWIELGCPWPDANPSLSNGSARQEAWQGHWAFQPLSSVAVPDGMFAPARSADDQPMFDAREREGDSGTDTIAESATTARSSNEVDQFIRQELLEHGLQPSPRADRRTLIRRVTFTLTGMPPTPAEVNRFVRDDRPDAYLRLVDELLSRPSYGQHWGRHWLDVARYSDTKGYVYAREERFWIHAWQYRDWIVQALNRDLPYDDFLRLQIAADLIDPHTPENLAAMGFLTLGRRFLGVTHDIIDDRIDVVTRGMMGLTVTCARCHDHKYDPISTAEYYSLYGVFQNCSERMVHRVSGTSMSDDGQPITDPEFLQRRTALLDALRTSREEAALRARQRIGDYLFAQTDFAKYPAEGFDQLLSAQDLIPAFVRRWHHYLSDPAREHDSIFLPWIRYTKIPAEDFSSHSNRIAQELSELPTETIHPRVRQLLEPPPNSARELADRYGQLFAGIDAPASASQTQSLVNTSTHTAEFVDVGLEPIRQVLYGADSPCVVPDESIVDIETYFDTPTCEKLWKLQGEVDRWLIEKGSVQDGYLVVLRDRNTTRPAHILRRGNPKNRGERVPRAAPGVICAGWQPAIFHQGSGRRELAELVASRNNPLTARVLVNRVWMHHFGEGLVKTPSDFGLRAAPPSHPELLDWLTSRFIEDGWSLKALHRRILLSATYQQSSSGPNDIQALGRAMEIDPDNRLLWRMNLHRLSWEELRDAMLAVCNRLDHRWGGKPADLFSSPHVSRRTLYGLVDRQFLPSVLRTFDFANPDLHIPQRSDTTVAQQALFLMNHPFVSSAAEQLVRSAIADPAWSVPERLAHLHEGVLQRTPNPIELEQMRRFVSEGTGPTDLPDQLDSWTQLVQALLLSNEFVFVD